MTQVGYRLDDGTVVHFEIDRGPDFSPAGADGVVGKLTEAAAPVVAGAKALLEQVRASHPDEVEVKFGVKVTGTANWLVAKAASEGNFEVTLTWKADQASA